MKQDIERISKYLGIKAAQFESQYLRKDEDNDWVLKQVPCSFLAADDSCSIYDARPKACREFPHTDRKKIYQIANITLANTAICPAAFDVVERMKESIKL
jgi:Fe-S-cluster containining protein